MLHIYLQRKKTHSIPTLPTAAQPAIGHPNKSRVGPRAEKEKKSKAKKKEQRPKPWSGHWTRKTCWSRRGGASKTSEEEDITLWPSTHAHDIPVEERKERVHVVLRAEKVGNRGVDTRWLL